MGTARRTPWWGAPSGLLIGRATALDHADEPDAGANALHRGMVQPRAVALVARLCLSARVQNNSMSAQRNLGVHQIEASPMRVQA